MGMDKIQQEGRKRNKMEKIYIKHRPNKQESMVCNYLGKGIRPKIQLEKFFTEARVSQVLLSFVKTRSQIVFINPTELLCWYPDWKNYELLSLSQ